MEAERELYGMQESYIIVATVDENGKSSTSFYVQRTHKYIYILGNQGSLLCLVVIALPDLFILPCSVIINRNSFRLTCHNVYLIVEAVP